MESHLDHRNKRRKRRIFRVRKKVRGSALKPRLSIFRSNKHLLAQLIDDESRVTLFGIGTMSKELKGSPFSKKGSESAKEIGKRVAMAAKKQKIEGVIFDRGRAKYHGIIAKLADAARAEGLEF